MTQLDKSFSKFIRLRDSKLLGPFLVIGRCCTCNKEVVVYDIATGYNANAHCGHYVARTHQSTRHNEKNAHLQCAECNIIGLGNPKEMSAYIDKKYGPGTAESLVIESKKLTKLFPYEIKELQSFYRKKVKELEKELGIC